jgi:hypothetical protein
MSKYFATYLVLICLAVSIAYADKVGGHGTADEGQNTNRPVDESSDDKPITQEISKEDTEKLLQMLDEVNHVKKTGEQPAVTELN